MLHTASYVNSHIYINLYNIYVYFLFIYPNVYHIRLYLWICDICNSVKHAQLCKTPVGQWEFSDSPGGRQPENHPTTNHLPSSKVVSTHFWNTPRATFTNRP